MNENKYVVNGVYTICERCKRLLFECECLPLPSPLEMLEEMAKDDRCHRLVITEYKGRYCCYVYGKSSFSLVHGFGDALESAIRACYDAWKAREK